MIQQKKKAIEKYREDNNEIFWQHELTDSLLTIFKKLNIKVRDYQLGLYGSYIKIDLNDDIGNLSGIRALTWLENNLFDQLRISRSNWIKNRKNYLKYGQDYRQGKIPPCPLTGICYDEDFLDSLKNSILKNNLTLKESFLSLVNTYEKILNDENDYQNSEEYISEHLIDNDYEFLESGSRY